MKKDHIADTNLGLSGMKRIPMPRIAAHRIPILMTMRQEANGPKY